MPLVNTIHRSRHKATHHQDLTKESKRESQEITLSLCSEWRHETVPLQLPDGLPMQNVRLRCRLPFAFPRELLSCACKAASGEEREIRVRVERARERRPDVNHALHEGEVLVVAVGQTRGQGAEDVV